MNPTAIYRALTVGAMRTQTQGLSDADRKAVSEYLTGANISSESGFTPPACTGTAAYFDSARVPTFSSWGHMPFNTRTVSSKVAGIDRNTVGRLRLKWAFGVAGGTRMRSHPSLAGGAIYFGADDGIVYALDGKTGGARWTFQAAVEVRTGIVISPWQPADPDPKPIAYFGDMVGNVYAVDTRTGRQLWSDRTDTHPGTTLTGTPALYGNRLYVLVSSGGGQPQSKVRVLHFPRLGHRLQRLNRRPRKIAALAPPDTAQR
jgi:polyvinyl alcohol dehydrogenase (cytochrome)